MFGAGLASGLLGIGSGAFKVMALDNVMKMPLKASSATSNLMMGVTAAASATIYFFNGSIRPDIAVPLSLGIIVGALSEAESCNTCLQDGCGSSSSNFGILRITNGIQSVWGDD